MYELGYEPETLCPQSEVSFHRYHRYMNTGEKNSRTIATTTLAMYNSFLLFELILCMTMTEHNFTGVETRVKRT